MLEKKICVLGLGYIGLPTAAILAQRGYLVAGVDVNKNVVDTVNAGNIHIVEPDLDRIVDAAVSSGKLAAFTTPQPSDVYIICVPTPFHDHGETPTPNIDFVLSAAATVAPMLKEGDIVILESTSPVGTTEHILNVFSKSAVDVDNICVAYCPERVLPGNIVNELVENDRIVGGVNCKSSARVAKFYRSFVTGEVFETNARTSEMCKLVENSFRDVNIAFANELSLICDKNGIDVWELITLANRHPRVDILKPGAGVGGHCIAVDPWFIVAEDRVNSRLIRSAREINDNKTQWVIRKSLESASQLSEELGKAITIACFGAAFKPDIDDLRESPALKVCQALSKSSFDLIVVEPNVSSLDNFVIKDIDEAIDQADLLIILVPHKPFLSPRIINKLCTKHLLDFVGLTS